MPGEVHPEVVLGVALQLLVVAGHDSMVTYRILLSQANPFQSANITADSVVTSLLQEGVSLYRMADQTFRNVIAGELCEAADAATYDVVDPATGEVYAQAPMSGEADVDRAYAAAASAFETWGETTPQERSLALLRIADAMEARAEELTAVEVKDTGKPFQLTLEEELPPTIDHFRFFAGAARTLEGRAQASTWPITRRGSAVSRSV